MKLKLATFLAISLMITLSLEAQTSRSASQYRKHPHWIQMMNDTSVNYFETIKAFREYYKERELPSEANEVKGNDTFEKEVGLEEENDQKSEKERERELRKSNPNEPNYSAEVRAFKGWFYSIQPWVRSDGSIVGPAEQQAIINQQRNELLETEKLNNKR